MLSRERSAGGETCGGGVGASRQVLRLLGHGVVGVRAAGRVGGLLRTLRRAADALRAELDDDGDQRDGEDPVEPEDQGPAASASACRLHERQRHRGDDDRSDVRGDHAEGVQQAAFRLVRSHQRVEHPVGDVQRRVEDHRAERVGHERVDDLPRRPEGRSCEQQDRGQPVGQCEVEQPRPGLAQAGPRPLDEHPDDEIPCAIEEAGDQQDRPHRGGRDAGHVRVEERQVGPDGHVDEVEGQVA